MFYLGMDVGGTKVAAAVVDQDGKMIGKREIPTRCERTSSEILDDMAQLATMVAGEVGGLENIASVGIGFPGWTDPDAGLVVAAGNLNWYDVPAKAEMEKRLNKPVYIGNDANVAALAEALVGALKGAKIAVLVTLGTGVGGGIVLDGKILTGAHSVGGEIGHMIIVAGGRKCACGSHGCLEQYASGTALLAAGRKTLKTHPQGAIANAVSGDADKVNARVVVDAAKAGDEEAIKVFGEYVEYLSSGLASLIGLLDPDVIAIGGGVSAAGDYLLDALREDVVSKARYRGMKIARIELATLGNDAGIIGAALLGR